MKLKLMSSDLETEPVKTDGHAKRENVLYPVPAVGTWARVPFWSSGEMQFN